MQIIMRYHRTRSPPIFRPIQRDFPKRSALRHRMHHFPSGIKLLFENFLPFIMLHSMHFLFAVVLDRVDPIAQHF